MAEQDADKTEPASGRRISEARDKGQVPASRELGTFVSLIAATTGLLWFGPRLYAGLTSTMRRGLTFDYQSLNDPDQALHKLATMSYDMLMAAWPWLALMMGAAIVSPLLLHGWLFTFTPLMPDVSRMSLAAGIKRMFSLQSVVELLKAVAKASLVGGVAIMLLWGQREVLVNLVRVDLIVGLSLAWSLILKIMLYSVAVLILVVATDVPYQLWQYYKNMRMTKQEVKDEAKESDGDPQVKARIRSLQREAARRRMMSAVPKADVIVTNPTHFAVALEYKPGMPAPRVVAKGIALLAERIIEIGKENKVPILRTPPFARALYKHAELETDIPLGLFTAAAEILAYVYQLRVYQETGGTAPTLPDDLSIPPELIPAEAE